MTKNITIEADVIANLSRLALAGRRQDIQMYVRKIANRFRDISPELNDKLKKLLIEMPAKSTPFRNESVAAIPVDHDSRLDLIRTEFPTTLGVEPIWTPEIAQCLEQLIQEREKKNELFDAGLAPTSSLLFTGKPGVGKTLAARWLATKLNLPLLILDLSAVMSSLLGKTGTNVRNVFDYAKGINCVLLLDELDSIAKRRDDSSEIGELKRLVTVLLQEIDDWPDENVLLAATNHPDLLDPAVWRRFDLQIDFPMPSLVQTKQAISYFLGQGGGVSERWIEILTHLYHGASYSDIERGILKLRRMSVIKNISTEDLLANWAKGRMASMSKEDRKEIAKNLLQDGYTQVVISEITGISRPTLRKLKDTIN